LDKRLMKETKPACQNIRGGRQFHLYGRDRSVQEAGLKKGGQQEVHEDEEFPGNIALREKSAQQKQQVQRVVINKTLNPHTLNQRLGNCVSTKTGHFANCNRKGREK